VSLCGELRHSTVLFRNVAEACARSGTLRMTEPIDRKTQARKRTNPEGSADGAEATSTPEQRAVIERYLKQRDSRPDAPRLSVKSKPNQPLTISKLGRTFHNILAFFLPRPPLVNAVFFSGRRWVCEQRTIETRITVLQYHARVTLLPLRAG
jgi:hypothetical protein